MSVKFSPEILLLNVLRRCRTALSDDIIHENHILYAALYSNDKSEIFKVYQDRYDFIWLKSHWDSVSKYICDNKLDVISKGQLISQFAKLYCKIFIDSGLDKSLCSDNVLLMQEIVSLKIGNLESIIEFDKRCDLGMERMKTSFMKSIKIMNDKIKQLEN